MDNAPTYAAVMAVLVTLVVMYSAGSSDTVQREVNIPFDVFSLSFTSNVAPLFGLAVENRLRPTLNVSVYTGDLCVLVTLHGRPKKANLNNVQVFTPKVRSNGVTPSSKAPGNLIDIASVIDLELQNLRGMAHVNDVMFVASAHSTTSKLVVMRKCASKPRKATVFSVDSLHHPYGVAPLGGSLFVTNQNADTVVRYRVQDGKGAKAKHFATVKHPRGLSFDNSGKLWVASTKEGVLVFNQDGTVLKQINMVHPIGVTCDRTTGLVYISSYDGYKKSRVYAINPDSFQVEYTLRPDAPYKLGHPAGLAIDSAKRVLFVVAQKENSVYAFNIETRTFLGVAIENFADKPEQILLSNCV